MVPPVRPVPAVIEVTAFGKVWLAAKVTTPPKDVVPLAFRVRFTELEAAFCKLVTLRVLMVIRKLNDDPGRACENGYGCAGVYCDWTGGRGIVASRNSIILYNNLTVKVED